MGRPYIRKHVSGHRFWIHATFFKDIPFVFPAFDIPMDFFFLGLKGSRVLLILGLSYEGSLHNGRNASLLPCVSTPMKLGQY